MKNRVWIFSADPGGMNGAVRVYRQLISKGVKVDVFASGFAAGPTGLITESDVPFLTSTLAVIWAEARPDLVITTMDNAGAIGYEMLKWVRSQNIPTPVLALGDYWVSAALKEWEYRPDFVTVNDALGRMIVHRAWPEMPLEHIEETGYPALDAYCGIDAQIDAMRLEVRGQLQLPFHTFFPVFFADLWGAVETFKGFLDGLTLSGLDDVMIGLRKHPRMNSENPTEAKALDELAKTAPVISVDLPMRIQPLLAALDLALATYSTVLGEAAAMRLPAVNLAFPTARSIYEGNTGDLSPIFPLTGLGCCAEASNAEQLAYLLTLAQSGQLGEQLEIAQQVHFRTDGQNTKRVAELVHHLLNH